MGFGEDLNRLQGIVDVLLLQVQEEIEEVDEQLKADVEELLLEWAKPIICDPYNPNNEILEKERDFEITCAVLEENGVHSPKHLTEFEYYSRLLHLKKKSDELQKQIKSKK